MSKIYKILLILSILAILTGSIAATTDVKTSVTTKQTLYGANQTNQTTKDIDSHILIEGWPPWDSTSEVQSTNTKKLFMKVDYLPTTDWLDIEGYYNQLNYFQLPITVKLVNGTNVPVKYKNIDVSIDEYETWYEGGWFTCNCWKYNYLTTYYKTKNTGPTGYAEYLFSIPYKGYDRNMYRIWISYYATNGDYVYAIKNQRVAWYINTAGAPTKEQFEQRIKTQNK